MTRQGGKKSASALGFLPRSLQSPNKSIESAPFGRFPTHAPSDHHVGGISMEFWNTLEVPADNRHVGADEYLGNRMVHDGNGMVYEPEVQSPPRLPEPAILKPGPFPDESLREYREYLVDVFGKMMFVSGETAEPSAETTWLIEEIVREQVVHMLKVATEYANRRGHKSITVADLIFQIRHDKSKVSRLKTFLSWKDVRKNVKDSDDKGGGGDAGDIDLEADGAQAPAAGGPAQKANKKQKLILPWDVESYYAVQVPERDDEEDEEEDEQNEATLARLASADERTRNMTKEEYVYWSDCRQASFTFRKGKRFREWAGFGTIVDTKPNDDVIDILGFLTFEIVQTLTETALKVKAEKDFANRKTSKGQGEKKRKREECSLFSMTEEGRTPVEPEHVREAFRRLQIPPKKATFFQQGWTGMRRPYRLI